MSLPSTFVLLLPYSFFLPVNHDFVRVLSGTIYGQTKKYEYSSNKTKVEGKLMHSNICFIAAILIFFRLPANHISNIHTYVPPYVRTDVPKKNRDVPTNESCPSRKSDGRKWPSRCCLTPTNPARPQKQVSRVYVCKQKSCSIKVATPSNFRLKNFFRYVQPRLCWVICRVWGYQPRQRGS